MLTWSNEKNPQYLLADDPTQQKTPEPEPIRMGRDTVLQWMQLCVDANAIKLQETENSKMLSLGSDHKPAWIATSYLYESYLATCRQQGTWYPVNEIFFGMVLTKILGPSCRSTTTPEDLAKIMFGQEKRARRPYGHYIPSSEKWQGLLDARLRIPKQTKAPKPSGLISGADGRAGCPDHPINQKTRLIVCLAPTGESSSML